MWVVEGVCGLWRGCVGCGGGVWVVEGVCGLWRGCVGCGGGVWVVEGVCGRALLEWRGEGGTPPLPK